MNQDLQTYRARQNPQWHWLSRVLQAMGYLILSEISFYLRLCCCALFFTEIEL
jgi:hypothetical protein